MLTKLMNNCLSPNHNQASSSSAKSLEPKSHYLDLSSTNSSKQVKKEITLELVDKVLQNVMELRYDR